MENKNEPEAYTEGSLPYRFDSWLRKVMFNVLRNQICSLKRYKDKYTLVSDPGKLDSLKDAETDDPYENLFSREIALGKTVIHVTDETLADALLVLDEREQKIIEALVILGMTNKDLAEEAKIEPHTVTNLKRQTLDKLRKLIEEDERNAEKEDLS